MRPHDAYVRVICSAVVVFAGSSFALADEPSAQPEASPAVQEEKATPAEAGEVKTRAARGSANTKTRAEWCGDHLIACYASGDSYCKSHYSDAASLKVCSDSVTESCGRSWGSASSCMTDAIVVGGTAVVPPTGMAPVTGTAPLTPQQQLHFQQQQLLRSRGVESESSAGPPAGEHGAEPK